MGIVDQHLLLDRAFLALRYLQTLTEEDEDELGLLTESLWKAMSAAEAAELEQRWQLLLVEFEAVTGPAIRPGQRVLVRLPEAKPEDHRVTGVVCWPGQEDDTWEVWCRDGGASWVEMGIPAVNLDIDLSRPVAQPAISNGMGHALREAALAARAGRVMPKPLDELVQDALAEGWRRPVHRAAIEALMVEVATLRVRLAKADLAPEYCVGCGADLGHGVHYGAGNGMGQKFKCRPCYREP